MTTKRTLVMVSTLCSLLGVSVASAHAGHGKRFEKLDANGDGVVSLEEMESRALERFSKADANNDGAVTTDERRAAMENHARERFAKRDANGNGLLERGEVEKMPEKFFARLDTDGNGALSPDELKAFGKAMREKRGGRGKRFDQNGDGAITQAEVVTKVRAKFQKLDKDGNGSLEHDELKSHQKSKGAERGVKGPRA